MSIVPIIPGGGGSEPGSCLRKVAKTGMGAAGAVRLYFRGSVRVRSRVAYALGDFGSAPGGGKIPTPRASKEDPATDEANVSAEEARSCEDPRFPGPDAHTLRERGDRSSSPEGSRQAFSVGSVPARRRHPGTLKKPADFERVLRQGRGVRGQTASVRVLARGDEGPPRFGFAVSKKNGGAVERNRIKRRWREVARSVGKNVRSGFDCVVIPRPEARAASFDACIADLSSVLRSLGLVSDSVRNGEIR
jgi:ribonuclease P protein component